ncbi:MAG: Crp/Fnr family transcriptional regulator, partial [Pacificimonas sp.]
LKLVALEPSGEERTVGAAFASDFVGAPLSDKSPFEVVALVDSDVCIYPRAAFLAALDDDRDLERELLRRTMADLDRARTDGHRPDEPADVRIARLLIDTVTRARQTAVSADTLIDLPLSRQDIADLTGLRIETVSRAFGKLENEGLIAREGRRGLRIVDADGLAGRAGVRTDGLAMADRLA